MQKILAILAATILIGCSSQLSALSIFNLTKKSSESQYQMPLHQVSINPWVKLNTVKLWPLKNFGTYLQKVTASVKGKKHTFSIHLTLNAEMLEAVAFNDMAGRLYTLQWTPQSVCWEGSSYIPECIKPENIIADFLLVHLPVNQLQGVLQGAIVFEGPVGFKLTRVIKNNQVLRSITYSNPIGKMWGQVTIENPEIGYKLDIQTVVQ
jgi:hypothetical protein